MRIQELTEYLDTYLRAGEFHDYAPNGLQVEGTREVKHIVLGVSASLGLIDEAARRGADVVLVHHGWFWKGESPRIAGVKGCRIRHLMQSGMHLVGYHLPLDAHETVGNNAELARVLGLTIESRHGEYGLLHVGEIIRERCWQPILPNELMQRLVEPRFLLAMRKKLSGASDGALALPKMNSRLLPP